MYSKGLPINVITSGCPLYRKNQKKRKSTTELIVAFLFLIFLVTNAITHCSNINTGTEHLGYTTAENSANSGRSSRSRGKQKTTKVTRVSRSLSRNKTSQSQLPLFKTPINKAPPNDYGFVTPKVKPNTPQVILRRPKEGIFC
ncbi:Cell division cycle-associated protein 8 [Popillia japonica]|uniref:Cell division cycle-associated protein 8 n=1 Tax=Popillia japonica TaxID=7064 RepID=A0AAW1HWT1_POPJA